MEINRKGDRCNIIISDGLSNPIILNVKSYGSIIGPIMEFFRFAKKLHDDVKKEDFYVNARSLGKAVLVQTCNEDVLKADVERTKDVAVNILFSGKKGQETNLSYNILHFKEQFSEKYIGVVAPPAKREEPKERIPSFAETMKDLRDTLRRQHQLKSQLEEIGFKFVKHPNTRLVDIIIIPEGWKSHSIGNSKECVFTDEINIPRVAIDKDGVTRLITQHEGLQEYYNNLFLAEKGLVNFYDVDDATKKQFGDLIRNAQKQMWELKRDYYIAKNSSVKGIEHGKTSLKQLQKELLEKEVRLGEEIQNFFETQIKTKQLVFHLDKLVLKSSCDFCELSKVGCTFSKTNMYFPKSSHLRIENNSYLIEGNRGRIKFTPKGNHQFKVSLAGQSYTMFSDYEANLLDKKIARGEEWRVLHGDGLGAHLIE